MKVFVFDKVSQDVRSFGALPREAWMTLGILELVCTVGAHRPRRVPLAAAADDTGCHGLGGRESRVRRGEYREITPMILSGVLGLLMAFIAYGRMVLKPIF
jgi:hypothetical protein